MEYDQRVIIKFLLNEKANARDIVDRLQIQFGEHVYKLQMVQFWITDVWFGRQDLHDEICTERPPLDDLDAKIMAILDKSPFKSTHSITETLHTAHSTVLLHLHDFVGFRSFHLRWVQHLLMHDLREKWKEYAKAMLPFLHAIERDGWYHYVTSDESWFFLNTPPRCILILLRDDVVTKPKLDIQSKNSCLWSYSTRVASMLSTDSQIISKWTATILWQSYSFYLNK
jgi:hypothetical protein